MSLDLLGAYNPNYVGVDLSALFKVAGGVLEGGGNILQQQQAEKESSADVQSKLEKAIAADQAATDAAVKADVSQQIKAPTAQVDMQAAIRAIAVQNQAGVGLPPEAAQKRTAAAVSMLTNAQKQSKAKPKDGYWQAAVKAWSATVNKLRSGAGSGLVEVKKESQESWWSRRVLGPIPGYGIIFGSVAIAGLLSFIIIRKIVTGGHSGRRT